MDIYELETPSVLIDLDKMERNIQRMQDLCDEAGVGLRPHIKTHKIPEIAKIKDRAARTSLCNETLPVCRTAIVIILNRQAAFNALSQQAAACRPAQAVSSYRRGI